jgi:hypothetical protein
LFVAKGFHVGIGFGTTADGDESGEKDFNEGIIDGTGFGSGGVDFFDGGNKGMSDVFDLVFFVILLDGVAVCSMLCEWTVFATKSSGIKKTADGSRVGGEAVVWTR